MTREASTVALGPGEGATIENPVGGAIVFKATAAETGGTMTVFETIVAPGEGPPLHVHANEDEAVYVLEGDLDFRLGPDLRSTPAGIPLHTPRDPAHVSERRRRRGAVPGDLRAVGHGRFFERMAADGSRAGDVATFAATGREVGLEVVGPPLAAVEAPDPRRT